MKENSPKRSIDKKSIDLLDQAMQEFSNIGTVKSIKCDICSSIIELKKLGDDAWMVHCSCGKFDDTLRGI